MLMCSAACPDSEGILCLTVRRRLRRQSSYDTLFALQVDLVVATPKRLAHLVKAKQIHLSSVQFLILDEADKLFELGFVTHIDAIIHACSNPGIVSTVALAATADNHTYSTAMNRDVCRDPVVFSGFADLSSSMLRHITKTFEVTLT